MRRELKKYIWTLKINVEGRDREEVRKYVKARLHMFVLRGENIGEGTLEEEKYA